MSNDTTCQPCPMFSEARNPGSAICECIPPNSRASGDDAAVACRGEGGREGGYGEFKLIGGKGLGTGVYGSVGGGICSVKLAL